jgi:hypothetical protein
MTDRFDGLEVLKIHHVLRKAGMADRMARGWALQQVETLFRNVVANVTYGMHAALCKQIASSRERARERITRRRTIINKVGSGDWSLDIPSCRHVAVSSAA